MVIHGRRGDEYACQVARLLLFVLSRCLFVCVLYSFVRSISRSFVRFLINLNTVSLTSFTWCTNDLSYTLEIEQIAFLIHRNTKKLKSVFRTHSAK